MIYIASPYSHPQPSVEQERYEKVKAYTTKLISEYKLLAFSPIVYGHQFRTDIEGSFEQWADFDKYMIRHSSCMHVFKLPGWEESVGVTAEIELAVECGIPIHYVEPK